MKNENKRIKSIIKLKYKHKNIDLPDQETH